MIPGSANPLLLKSAAAAAGGLQIERSLRFNSSDSGYLSRVPAVAGNRTTWTWSGWVKRSAISSASTQVIFDAFSGNGGNYFLFQFTPADVIQIYLGPSVGELVTTSVYRDASAWYHFVLAYDTTQATPANRIRLYVNNVEVTTFSTATYPSQNNANNYVNSTVTHHIGTFNAIGDYFNGYLTNIHLIDGQQLTPSSFTETDATTGQLIPKTYTGSYGTNGFNLLFADNSSNTASTLGKDTSPNGNNWTPNNLSVTAGAGNDSLVDSPTSYGTDTGVGGEVRGNYCTWNPLDKAPAVNLANGNLDASATASGEDKVRGTIALPVTGKWFYEVTIGSSYQGYIGIASASAPLTGGTGAKSYGYNETGRFYTDGSFTSSQFASFATGDVIGVAVDTDADTLSFYKNGSQTGTSKSIDGIYQYFPMLNIYSGSFAANFGQRPFAYTAPSGFKALCTTNLPAPLVAKPSTVFDVITYTGTGSSLTLPNGSSTPTSIAFTPDFAWLKGRSGATNHALYDAVRGVQKDLVSNSIDAETTQTTGLTAFGTNTLTVGSLAKLNTSSATYVAWAWNAGGTTDPSNQAGSITSQVRANPTAGFSIVKYTGLLGGGSWGHGLGVEPKFIIFKRYTAAQNWWVFHKTTGSWRKFEGLNNTNADSADSMSASSTVVTLVTNTDFNSDPSSNYFAYCFAPVVGYSSFGSYVGNGSSDGPMVYTGFRPRWILIKRTDSADDWNIFDSVRSSYNVMGHDLLANRSDAEYTGSYIDALSNGFKIRETNSSRNASGGTYIYAAFAESPLNYSRAR